MIGPLSLVASLAILVGELDPGVLAPREVEFPFQDELRLVPGQTNAGKAWRSRGLPYDGGVAPLIIFVHGIIFDGERHHWLTVDRNGPWDARPFIAELVDRGAIAPVIVAVPSQTRNATDPSKLFLDLDFDAFVDAVDRALAPHQRVDRARIVVFGHSGSACDPANASFAALRAQTFRPRALIAVDGCMAPLGARHLASTTRARDVIVTYQEQLWPERPFAEFRAAWSQELERSWPPGLRILERLEPTSGNGHLALVELTARRFLPVLLPPIDRIAWTAVLPSAQLPALPSVSSFF